KGYSYALRGVSVIRDARSRRRTALWLQLIATARPKEIQILFEVTGQQKIFPNCLLRLASHFVAQFLVINYLHHSFGCLVDRGNQESVHTVFDLVADPAHVAANYRCA